MASLFTKIINKELPAHIVAENNYAIAFLDIQPLAIGHTLVVPRTEVDNYFNLDEKNYTELNLFSKKVAAAMAKALPCQRVGVAIIGLEVPHAHIHLIPINTVSDINFAKEKLQPDAALMQETCKKIQKYI